MPRVDWERYSGRGIGWRGKTAHGCTAAKQCNHTRVACAERVLHVPHAHCTSVACTWTICCMCITYRLHSCCVYVACILHVCRMSVSCVWCRHIRYMYDASTLHACCMLVQNAQLLVCACHHSSAEHISNSIYMFIHMSVHMSKCMSIHMSVHMSKCMSIHMSMHEPMHMSMHMSVHVSKLILPSTVPCSACTHLRTCLQVNLYTSL